MGKVQEFKNKHNTLLKVTGGVLIAAVSFRLGQKFEDGVIINSLKNLARTEKMRCMYIDGEKYILSMIKESDLIK